MAAGRFVVIAYRLAKSRRFYLLRSLLRADSSGRNENAIGRSEIKERFAGPALRRYHFGEQYGVVTRFDHLTDTALHVGQTARKHGHAGLRSWKPVDRLEPVAREIRKTP